MKKILLVAGFLLSLVTAFAQNPVIVNPPQRFLQFIVIAPYTTANRPVAPYPGEFIFNTDSSAPQMWNSAAWVTFPGNGSGGNYVPGYGIKFSGSNILFDSAHARKVDSLYAITDSTYGFYINGKFYTFKARGSVYSVNGRIGAVVLNMADIIAALGYTPLPSITTITVNTNTQNLNSSPVFSFYFIDSLRRSSDSVYGRTNGVWSFQFIDSSGGSGGSGDSLLSQLKDVNVSSPANLSILQFQTSDNKWHPNILSFLQASNNLSDLSSASTARTNLGLATVAHSGAFGDLTGFSTLTLGSGLLGGSFTGLSPVTAKIDTGLMATLYYVNTQIASVPTLYSINGSLASNRTVAGAGHSLTINNLSAMNFTVTGADGNSSVSTSNDTSISVNTVDNAGDVSGTFFTPHSVVVSSANAGNANISLLQFLDTAAIMFINNNIGQSNNYVLTLIDSIHGKIKFMPAISGGSTNTSIGAGYRFAVNLTNNIKSFFAVSPILLDSSTNTNAITAKLDTSVVHTSAYNNATYQPIGSYVSSFSNVNITSGSSSTVSGGQQIITINPSSTLATYTLTLSGSPNNNDVIIIRAGGTITSGVVVTSFALAGISIIDPNQPTFLIAGQDYVIRYATPVTSYYPN